MPLPLAWYHDGIEGLRMHAVEDSLVVLKAVGGDEVNDVQEDDTEQDELGGGAAAQTTWRTALLPNIASGDQDGEGIGVVIKVIIK